MDQRPASLRSITTFSLVPRPPAGGAAGRSVVRGADRHTSSAVPEPGLLHDNQLVIMQP
jgi:hypothetical protein